MISGEPGLAVYLLLRGRRVVVVGGGKVAAAKVQKLLAAGAAVIVVAPALDPALATRAAANEVAWTARTFAAPDIDGAWFVVAATGNPVTDAAVFAACESARVWCNAVDLTVACSAYWMAQRHAGAAVLAAGTGGAAPGLAGRIADEALAGLPAQLPQLVDHYAQARAAVLAAVPGEGPQAQVRGQALRRLARQPWPTLGADPAQLAAAVQSEIAAALEGSDGPGGDGEPGAA